MLTKKKKIIIIIKKNKQITIEYVQSEYIVFINFSIQGDCDLTLFTLEFIM